MPPETTPISSTLLPESTSLETNSSSTFEEDLLENSEKGWTMLIIIFVLLSVVFIAALLTRVWLVFIKIFLNFVLQSFTLRLSLRKNTLKRDNY